MNDYFRKGSEAITDSTPEHTKSIMDRMESMSVEPPKSMRDFMEKTMDKEHVDASQKADLWQKGQGIETRPCGTDGSHPCYTDSAKHLNDVLFSEYDATQTDMSLDLGKSFNAEGKPLSITRTTVETLLLKTGPKRDAPFGFDSMERADGTTPVMDYPEIEEELRTYKVSTSDCIAYADNEFDYQYLDNLRYLLANGERRSDRTGISTISAFGDIGHKIDLRRAYPATTLKGFAFKTMKGETIDWMLKGKYDLKTLKDLNIRIWDQNVKPGTEVFKEVELSRGERKQLMTPGQISLFAEYNRVYHERDDATDEGWLEFSTMKLNNWGVPETKQVLADGDLGPIYGKQWRAWEDLRMIRSSELYGDAWEKYGSRGFEPTPFDNGRDWTLIRREIDQIALIEKAIQNEIKMANGEIERHREGRRIILTGWNVAQLDEMSLPPCHTLAQWYVSQTTDKNGQYYLDCTLYQRSCDMLLGCCFNVAQYALITEMLAKAHGLTARFLHHTIGDAHIYANHLDQVQELLDRGVGFKSPRLQIDGEPTSLLDIPSDDVSMIGYESYAPQKNVPIAK